MALEHEIRPIHLRPTSKLAERVLLPGDPRRALLTVQATGMGGPSAATSARS